MKQHGRPELNMSFETYRGSCFPFPMFTCVAVSLPPPTKAYLWCAVDNMEESTVIIDRKKFASRRGEALRTHRRHQVSPHVSDRNGGKQMTEVGPALLSRLPLLHNHAPPL